MLAFFGTSLGKGSGEALLRIFSDLGMIWGAIGEAFGLHFPYFSRSGTSVFEGPFQAQEKELLGVTGLPAALPSWGGVPLQDNPGGVGHASKLHTPSGQARPGAADIYPRACGQPRHRA